MSTIPSGEEARFADASAQPGADVALLAPIARLIAAHEGTQSLLAFAPVSAAGADGDHSRDALIHPAPLPASFVYAII